MLDGLRCKQKIDKDFCANAFRKDKYFCANAFRKAKNYHQYLTGMCKSKCKCECVNTFANTGVAANAIDGKYQIDLSMALLLFEAPELELWLRFKEESDMSEIWDLEKNWKIGNQKTEKEGIGRFLNKM